MALIGLRKTIQTFMCQARQGSLRSTPWPVVCFGVASAISQYDTEGQLKFLMALIRGHIYSAHTTDECLDRFSEIYALSSHQVECSSMDGKTNVLENTASTFGPTMSAGASKSTWAAINVVLAYGGKKRNTNPTCTRRLTCEGRIAKTPTEVVGSMVPHLC